MRLIEISWLIYNYIFEKQRCDPPLCNWREFTYNKPCFCAAEIRCCYAEIKIKFTSLFNGSTFVVCMALNFPIITDERSINFNRPFVACNGDIPFIII